MLILSPIPKQFLDESGIPYTNGTVSIYLHGDTELADVYVDPEGTALIENPCILDSHGMWQGFVDPDKPLDYIVKDSEGNVITRFCNISLPTGDDIPEVKVISSDGSINVDETLENGERVFDITVNDDMMRPSCAKFSHEAVNGGGEVSFDSFELEGDPDRDIYLADGVITLAEGVYHISANFVIGNDECHNEYFGITVNFGDCSTAKVWDRSFVHEESVEFGLDIVADVDGYTVVPTIAELPDGMHCSVSRLYIHKVSGAGVGGSMASVEHDGTLVGDGTHNDPLGVKDWSEIRTTLENTTNELLDHEVSHSAHQDIRDDIEYEANRAQAEEAAAKTEVVQGENCTIEKTTAADGHDVYTVNADGKPQVQADWNQADSSAVDYIKNKPNLGLKADKVQGATAGNLAALDASGNLTDSGSKAADFKTKQTPVASPDPSGNSGLNFIDSVSQNENGEVVLHKNTVQNASTTYKGVVKLSNAIDSTSVTEAATPKAVKDAYDELNNKIVARAVFLSQAEWAVQSQLQGDPAKVYYVENGTGEDAYTVYVWRESTSTYEEVDESSIDLDGYWHDSPTTTGNGNVVTDITLGNDGVPQVEKGMSAEPAFSVLPVNKGGTGKTTGKAATNNLFSDINNVNTDPDDTAIIVFKYGSPSDSNGIFFARAITNLWNYIQNKISSVLGLTASSYSGNAATASAAASGSALETAINAKVDSNKSVAIGDVRVSRTGQTGSGWYKVAETPFNNAGSNVNAAFDVYASRDNRKYVGNLSFCVRSSATDVTVNYNKLFTDNWSSIYNFKIVVKGIINAATIEIWASCNFIYGGVALVERNTSDYTSGDVKNKWSYIPHLDDGGTDAPVSDSANNVYVYDTDIVVRQDASGDGSNLSVTPDGTSTGYDLGSSTTLKAFTQKFKNLVGALKALAFKDKVSDSDINGTISDNHIASASRWNGKADKANITGATKCKITYNGQGIVTSGADLDASDIPNLPASKITSGTFDEARIPTSLPNVTAGAASAAASGSALATAIDFKASITLNNVYGIRPSTLNISGLTGNTWYNLFDISIGTYTSIPVAIKIQGRNLGLFTLFIRWPHSESTTPTQFSIDSPNYTDVGYTVDPNNSRLFHIWLKTPGGLNILSAVYEAIGNGAAPAVVDGTMTATSTEPTNLVRPSYSYPIVARGGKGSPTTPVYVDSNGQVQPCTASNILKSNTATLYIAGYTGNNIPYYHVKDIKNGCVNHVDFSGITNSTCDITFEAPTLSNGEEYDYIISLEGYTNNSGYTTGVYVENCKQVLRYDYVNNLWIGEPLFLQATDWRQICVVRGNTCEWKRATLS